MTSIAHRLVRNLEGSLHAYPYVHKNQFSVESSRKETTFIDGAEAAFATLLRAFFGTPPMAADYELTYWLERHGAFGYPDKVRVVDTTGSGGSCATRPRRLVTKVKY